MDIRTVASSDEGISLAASVIAQGVRSAWAERREAHVVLTGGRTGAALAASVSTALDVFADGRVHVWIGDERYVEFDDPDRNDTAIIAALPDDEPNLQVHRHLAPHQAEIEDAAQAYAGELEALLADAPFDAVVLSAGEDGHVASVFPGHVQHYENAYAECASPKPPMQRTTISLARLANARKCLVLALGDAKADAVRGFVAGDMTLPMRQLAAIAPFVLVTDVRVGMAVAAGAVAVEENSGVAAATAEDSRS